MTFDMQYIKYIFREKILLSVSVVDPYSFFTDPDPDPQFDVGDQYGSRALMTKSWKKNYSWKKNKFFFYQKLQFTYP